MRILVPEIDVFNEKKIDSREKINTFSRKNLLSLSIFSAARAISHEISPLELSEWFGTWKLELLKGRRTYQTPEVSYKRRAERKWVPFRYILKFL